MIVFPMRLIIRPEKQDEKKNLHETDVAAVQREPRSLPAPSLISSFNFDAMEARVELAPEAQRLSLHETGDSPSRTGCPSHTEVPPTPLPSNG